MSEKWETQEYKTTFTAEETLQDFREWLLREMEIQKKASEDFDLKGDSLLAEYHHGKFMEARICYMRLEGGEQQKMKV